VPGGLCWRERGDRESAESRREPLHDPSSHLQRRAPGRPPVYRIPGAGTRAGRGPPQWRRFHGAHVRGGGAIAGGRRILGGRPAMAARERRCSLKGSRPARGQTRSWGARCASDTRSAQRWRGRAVAPLGTPGARCLRGWAFYSQPAVKAFWKARKSKKSRMPLSSKSARGSPATKRSWNSRKSKKSRMPSPVRSARQRGW
jgi:hypothetical protein